MKLIIDIPEEAYKACQKLRTNNDYEIIGICAVNSIAYGIPLDDVKAEIETNLSWDMFDEYGNETRLHKELMEILNNIGEEESEEEKDDKS